MGTILSWIILSKLVAAVLYVIFTLLKLIIQTVKQIRNKSTKVSSEEDVKPAAIVSPEKDIVIPGSFKIEMPNNTQSYKEYVGTMENRPALTISPITEMKASLRPKSSVALSKPRTLKRTPKNRVSPSQQHYTTPQTSTNIVSKVDNNEHTDNKRV